LKTEGVYRIDATSLVEDELLAELICRGKATRSSWAEPEEVLLQGTEYPLENPRERLYSTSIFWPGSEDHQVRGTPLNDFKWFRENVLPHKLAWKFFEPLNRRKSEFRNGVHRLYLDRRLRGAAFFLMETYGFDQVFLMPTGEEPMREGMLWRYLPLFDNWRDVVCTGVDSYKEPLQTEFLDKPYCAGFEPVMVPGRLVCPFAGPVRCRLKWSPQWTPLPNLMTHAMDGFLEMWSELPETFATEFPKLTKLLHFNRTRNQRRLKITDATFLTAVFWNRRLLDAGSWSFICDHSHRFASHEIQ
jgi:hypothetical protein